MSEESQRVPSERLRETDAAGTRIPTQEVQRVYEFGPFRLDAVERKLLRGDQIVPLTPKAFDTLLLLVQNAGHLLEKDELIRRLWPETFVEEGSLSNNIFLLRKALGEQAAFIETVPRRGYRFVGAVRQFPQMAPLGEHSTDHRHGPSMQLEVLDVPARPSLPANPRRPWPTRASATTAVVALLIALPAAVWFYKLRGRGGETIDSVAVLPFMNVRGDPNAEYLSDGITEGLINGLSQLPNLRVMSRDSAFRYKGKQVDPSAIGRQLGVRAILEGRVTELDGTLNVSVELIDSRDDSHIWGEQYSRRPSDIFAVQTDLAKEITAALRMHLTRKDELRMEKTSTSIPEAYHDYLKGRYLWNKRTPDMLNKGIEAFQQAIAKDPAYEEAYSGIADCYILLGVYGSLPAKEAYPKAKEAALNALELDGTLVEAHVSLARIQGEYDWNWSAGEREFQRAIALNPNYATAHQWYGDVLETMGRPEEAVGEYKRALELDPLSLIINRSLGQAFLYAREYDQAIEQLQRTLELDPYFPGTHNFLSQAYLHDALFREGVVEMEKGLAIFPNSPFEQADLAYAYAVSGRRAEAQRMLDRLNQLSTQEFVPADAMAKIYAALGEKGKAFEWLEKGYERRSLGLGGVDLKVDAVWDPLRSDLRFANLLRRMNLQP